MLAFILLILAASAVGGWLVWRKGAWRESWLNPGKRPALFHWLTVGALVAAFGLELVGLFLRYYNPGQLNALYVRSLPLLILLFLICIQMAVWLLVLRFGRGLRRFWRQSLAWILGWTVASAMMYWAFSPAGGGALHTWWYIQTFDPAHYERHGADYCSADYSGTLEKQYTRASLIRTQLANIDRLKALKAIFDKITSGAKTNTEKHLKLLHFIQSSTYHTEYIPSYSPGDWVYDPLVLLELGNMYCTQGAIMAIDLFGAAGYPGRLVQLAQHQIAEIYYDGSWHYFDTDLFGNGETVLDSNGKIPSVAEMSRAGSQRLDALPAYQEFGVMDCTNPNPGPYLYPSYWYFSDQAYLTDVPQGYLKGSNGAFEFERGWKAVEKIDPKDIVATNDLPPKLAPTKPTITDVQLNSANTSLTVSFTATDQDQDLAGYQVFVSEHSRGWDYNQFYGAPSARKYWADVRGWRPEMYGHLFELPSSDGGLVQLAADKKQVVIPVRKGLTYFITVMPFDSYGISVGRVLYPESNELKITVP